MKFCLIVDDSPAVRKINRAIMEGLGFICTEAGDGADALKICSLLTPEIVILDWNMPVMNGFDFLKMLRGLRLGRYPKVFFCTSEVNPDFIKEGLAAGADGHIPKPIEEDMLLSKLKEFGFYKEITHPALYAD